MRALFTKSPVNVAKNTSEEQGDGELKNLKEIYRPACSQNWVVSEHAFGTGPAPVWDQVRLY